MATATTPRYVVPDIVQVDPGGWGENVASDTNGKSVEYRYGTSSVRYRIEGRRSDWSLRLCRSAAGRQQAPSKT